MKNTSTMNYEENLINPPAFIAENEGIQNVKSMSTLKTNILNMMPNN